MTSREQQYGKAAERFNAMAEFGDRAVKILNNPEAPPDFPDKIGAILAAARALGLVPRMEDKFYHPNGDAKDWRMPDRRDATLLHDPENDVGPLDDLRAMIRAHDVHWMMADDPRASARGRGSEARIRAAVGKLTADDLLQARAYWLECHGDEKSLPTPYEAGE